MLSPDSEFETKSLVQPGRTILAYQFPPELPGTLRIIGDSLTGPQARGSFAAVFRGEWDRPGHEPATVAIKRVNPPGKNIPTERFLTRIRRETVIWTSAAHANILPFFGYQIVDSIPILVSPWCENGNLSDYINARPQISRGKKIKLLADAARGLVHLHQLDPQIVHGDIKPQNVIVKNDLAAALCDFGISKLDVGLGQHTGLTTSGKTEGTSGYQAKEILEDEPATLATDVYAFGGVILAAMSGKQPFWKKSVSATTLAVFKDKTPDPVDHPTLPANDPLWGLMVACWSGSPTERPRIDVVLQTLEIETARE